MKILYIVSTLRSCGPTNQLLYIIKYLDIQQFEPIVLTLSPEPKNSLWSKFQQLNIPLYSLNLSRWQGILLGESKLKSFVSEQYPAFKRSSDPGEVSSPKERAAMRGLRSLRQYQPNIIHSQGIRPDTLAAKYLSDYQTVATIRNYPYHDYVMKYGKLIGSYSAQKHINALKKIKFPVSCSNTISNMVKKHGVKSQIVCNGVDENLYIPPTSEEKTKLKHKLNLPLEAKIIVSVGALIARKQPEAIVRGFLASQAQKNSILLIIGDGTLLNSCQAIAENSSKIKFIGQVNNVVDYLKVADYFVSASVSEGLPNSVIEALSCGVPVCLSDIEPHREILNFNQQAGVMFSTGNIEDLTTQLNRLVNIESESMSVAARSIVCEHLNARKVSENYQSIYSKLYLK
ncbi:conserved hypothetical protein [Hyella patelloides LEGE 07179]|uniref:Glycosyl transferase family 1 domain-containing protein n=1 Tax=Hyella patelloides LEGE 07179 TaxID=945734 RepID=A0A563VPD5_9CYAN|nr:glycosyltransferase family 4 protein [Hyella patelloides]VEP13239.1 conserved hypothetical protein [Hyella patelloides LEGE 07179]